MTLYTCIQSTIYIPYLHSARRTFLAFVVYNSFASGTLCHELVQTLIWGRYAARNTKHKLFGKYIYAHRGRNRARCARPIKLRGVRRHHPSPMCQCWRRWRENISAGRTSPSDWSSRAQYCSNFALNLARHLHIHFRVVYIYSIPSPTWYLYNIFKFTRLQPPLCCIYEYVYLRASLPTLCVSRRG